MNFLKNIGIFSIMLAMFSCTENTFENASIALTDYGTLSLKLTDQEDNPISDCKFYVIDIELIESLGSSSLSTEQLAVTSATTDENGNIDFGKLNTGLYYIFANYTDEDNYNYDLFQFLQVVSGENTEKTISLKDYFGTVSITSFIVDNQTSGYPTSQLDSANLLLVPYNSSTSGYVTDFSLNTLKAISVELGKTDTNGEISGSNIPFGNYYIVAYYNDNQYDFLSEDYYGYDVYSLYNSDKNTWIGYAEADEINVDELTSTSLFVYYLEENSESGTTDTIALSNAYIMFSTTSSSSFSSAYNSADQIIQTNSEGKCSFEVGSEFNYSSYYLWVYIYSGNYTSYRIGSISTSSLRNNSIKLEVPESTFNIDFGNVNVNAKAKYITGLTFDTLLLDNTSLLLTTSTTSYFPGESNGYTTSTNENGEATFSNVAVGTYYLWAYTDDNHEQRAYNIITVTKDKTVEVNPVYDAIEVKTLTADMNLDFYAVQNGTNVPIKDAYVILSQYNNSSVENALNYALKAGKTSENGTITFTDIDIDDTYYVMIYRDEDTYYRTTLSKIYYNNSNEISIEASTSLIQN